MKDVEEERNYKRVDCQEKRQDKKALEEIPRDKLKDVLARLKAGQNVDNIDGIPLPDRREALDQVSEAIQQGSNNQVVDGGADIDNNNTQAGFMSKYGMWIGIGAVVIIGGYFAYKKFGK